MKILTLTFLFILSSCNNPLGKLEQTSDNFCGAAGYCPDSETVFVPSSILGLKIWIDPSDSSTVFSDSACSVAAVNSGRVACVTNKADLVKTFRETSLVNQPEYNSTYLEFDRSRTTRLVSDDNYIAPTRMYFIVSESYSLSFYQTIVINGASFGSLNNFFQIYNDGNYCVNPSGGSACDQVIASASMNTPTLISGYFDAVNVKIGSHFNGTSIGEVATSIAAVSSDKVFLGSWRASSSVSLDGRIYEVLMFDNVLSADDRGKIEGYMACKWNLQGSLPVAHPHRTNCP